MLNYEKIKNDFPLLNKQAQKKPIVYFDSACMSLKPKQVIEAMNEYYFYFPACSGRSSHRLGELVTKKIKEARQIVANFINADEQEVIFTRNTTEAVNLLANSLDLKNEDLVLTTDKEHNSNLIPWQMLIKKKGIRHEIVKSKNDGTFDFEKYKELVKTSRLVSMVHTSNLDGTTIPAKEIIKTAHENGVLVFLDAAQSAPHIKIDVKDLDVDFLAFSGHKMLGPTGTGVLYGKKELLEKLDPFITGGGTVDFSDYRGHHFLPVPDKFEGGLQNYAGIIGLSEAVKYLESVGWDNISKAEKEINKFITDELLKIDGIKIIGPENSDLRGSIISFNFKDADSHQITLMLDSSANIMTRSGQFCVHSWFGARNVAGAVRMSFYFYNSLEEAKIFVENIKKI